MADLLKTLQKLDQSWNQYYMLFADNGILCLIRKSDGLVIDTFVNIDCDGGDPDKHYANGETYIVQIPKGE